MQCQMADDLVFSYLVDEIQPQRSACKAIYYDYPLLATTPFSSDLYQHPLAWHSADMALLAAHPAEMPSPPLSPGQTLACDMATRFTDNATASELFNWNSVLVDNMDFGLPLFGDLSSVDPASVDSTNPTAAFPTLVSPYSIDPRYTSSFTMSATATSVAETEPSTTITNALPASTVTLSHAHISANPQSMPSPISLLQTSYDGFKATANSFYALPCCFSPSTCISSTPVSPLSNLPLNFDVSLTINPIQPRNQSASTHPSDKLAMFSNELSLLRSTDTSASAKPFPCATCDKVFRRKADCIRHSRIHTGERPYKCSACPESFARQDALKRHISKCGNDPGIFRGRHCESGDEHSIYGDGELSNLDCSFNNKAFNTHSTSTKVGRRRSLSLDRNPINIQDLDVMQRPRKISGKARDISNNLSIPKRSLSIVDVMAGI